MEQNATRKPIFPEQIRSLEHPAAEAVRIPEHIDAMEKSAYGGINVPAVAETNVPAVAD